MVFLGGGLSNLGGLCLPVFFAFDFFGQFFGCSALYYCWGVCLSRDRLRLLIFLFSYASHIHASSDT